MIPMGILFISLLRFVLFMALTVAVVFLVVVFADNPTWRAYVFYAGLAVAGLDAVVYFVKRVDQP